MYSEKVPMWTMHPILPLYSLCGVDGTLSLSFLSLCLSPFLLSFSGGRPKKISTFAQKYVVLHPFLGLESFALFVLVLVLVLADAVGEVSLSIVQRPAPLSLSFS